MAFLADQELIRLLQIKPTDRVLDIGGSFKQHDLIRIDTLVDIVPPEKTLYHPSKSAAGHFVQLDVVQSGLPFKAKEFDVCLCTHTLEDLTDPVRIIREMSRVARRGFIATPSRGKDMEFSHYDLTNWHTGPRRVPGLSHHFWFFENINGQMRITVKNYPLLYTREFQITRWLGDDEFRYIWKNKIDFSVVNPLNFQDLIRDYRDFVRANNSLLRRSYPVLLYLDNPFYYIKEFIKLLLKRGRGFTSA